MPTIKRPDSVVTGAGNPSSGTAQTPTLSGAGMVGPGPNVGAPSPTPTPTAAYVDGVAPASISGLTHTLDDLRARVPGEPPRLGEFARHRPLTESGIPDWGILKLNDASLTEKGVLSTDEDPSLLHPYYFEAPSPALDAPVFNPTGADPATDTIWNTGVGTVPGAGAGQTSAGGYTRAGARVNTTAILTRSGVADGPLAARQAVTISGMLYPADRGVLALLYWPPGGDVGDFLALPLLERCVAALNLGQGLTRYENADSDACDGGTGAISYTAEDPTAFPGRYTGHYNLREICLGVDDLDGDPLNAPFDDLDNDGNPGCARVANADAPTPPQVRLGSSLDAGEPVETYGIPILGGGTDAYDGSVPALLGSTRVIDSNFFSYRLPVLDDYSEATGLKYTPRGISGHTTRETARFFVPESDNTLADPFLTTAGGYTAYEADNVALQIARFRHTFSMPSTELLGVTEDAGSYALIHFVNEAGFEAFVRDGDLTAPVYGAQIDFTGDTLEQDRNLVNKATVVAPPQGPAPDYGYAARPYHVVRKSVVLDATAVDPGLTLDSGSFTWASSSTDVVTSISGVHYFVPNTSGGVSNFTLTDIDFKVDPGLFADTYRTGTDTLTAGVAPALPSAFNPALLCLHTFSNSTYGADLPTFTQTLSTDVFPGRIELSVGVVASLTPATSDNATISYGTGVVLLGDGDQPSFSTDAGVQLICRKTRGNTSATLAALPYSATNGHGFELPASPSTTLLFHTTSRHASITTRYGNFVTGSLPSPAVSTLVFAEKDYTERFLDEVYRCASSFTALTASENLALNGPGLGAWAPAGIEVPIRFGTTTGAFDADSWLQNGTHVSALGGGDLQVAGMPRRNPVLAAQAIKPVPSAGLLIYPQTDYSTGYSPEAVTDLSVLTQPDYSAATGTRRYVRVFDMNKGGTRDLDGASLVTIRLDGLTLEDFAHSGTGLGNPTSGIAVLIKVPGLTTYLDLGRVDGSGPSKQSTTDDGAGCRVVGPETITSAVDPETGLVYCEITAFVGPMAALFTNTGVNGSEVGTIPLIVAVVMTATAAGYNLQEPYVSPGVFTPGAAPGSANVRGLFGISIV